MLQRSPISRDFPLERSVGPSVTWAAQPVSVVSGAYIKQKAHLEVRLSCLLGRAQAFEDKDVGKDSEWELGLLYHLADSRPPGPSSVAPVSGRDWPCVSPLRAKLSDFKSI